MVKNWTYYRGEPVIKVAWKLLNEEVIAPLGNATNTVHPCDRVKYVEMYAGSELDDVIQQAAFL
ncbi:hypothetical protein JCM19233_7507 [Vibrio astriarenae]|nr:hypothetical protein JCM19233_7507 [Vibrio sp. C7]